MFLPNHIAGRFSCFYVAIRTRRGGVRMGVETVLLIVILTFVAGYLLNRWDTRRDRYGADRSRKEQEKR